eukprot:1661802-Rhodomonas_salina.1
MQCDSVLDTAPRGILVTDTLWRAPPVPRDDLSQAAPVADQAESYSQAHPNAPRRRPPACPALPPPRPHS